MMVNEIIAWSCEKGVVEAYVDMASQDQFLDPHSLIRAFIVCLQNHCLLKTISAY